MGNLLWVRSRPSPICLIFDVDQFHSVTGGAQGLGLALAKGFLEHGASKVALLDWDAEGLGRAEESLVQLYPDQKDDIISRKVDVTNAENLRRTVTEVSNRFGGIQILMICAGIVPAITAVDYTPEQFRSVIDVTINGGFLTAQAVAR